MSAAIISTESMVGYHLVESKLDDDCGCLEEEWECPVGSMFFHLQPSGCAEVLFDNGETEWEVEIEGGSVDGFWEKLINYIDSLPILD